MAAKRVTTDGPSPRGWGEQTRDGTLAGLGRTIPTRVGRTKVPTGKPAWLSDHPHAGGENDLVGEVNERMPGPSPRGWGEHDGVRAGASVHRTIPTRVGRTAGVVPSGFGVPDHPHAGGENSTPARWLITTTGPSPRGCGEPGASRDDRRQLRTIPTRVGRTKRLKIEVLDVADHPHAGGENANPCPFALNAGGPSPRGWGEHRRRSVSQARPRTIPTRVGRTLPVASALAAIADHPHAGGENFA